MKNISYSFLLILALMCLFQLPALGSIHEARIPIDSVCSTCINDGFIIRESGSYYLTRDLATSQQPVNLSSVRVIQILTSNVTLDLNGFTISHTAPTQGASETAISISSQADNVVIKNGIVKGFGGSGITGSRFSQHLHFRDLVVEGNGKDGIAGGDFSTFINVVANNNSLKGIEADDGAQIRNCIAIGNGDAGIYVDEGGQIFNCQAAENGSHGIEARGLGNTIDGCVTTSNGEAGIYASSTNMIRKCTSSDNGQYGIYAGGGTVSHCIANGNKRCVLSSTAPCISTLGSASNVTAPGGTGISGKNNVVIFGCHANANMIGIFISSSNGTAFNNYCEGNDHQGLVGMPQSSSLSSAMHMRNTCHNNGVTGIASLTALGIPPGEFYFTGADISYGPIIDFSTGGNLLTKPNANHPTANFKH